MVEGVVMFPEAPRIDKWTRYVFGRIVVEERDGKIKLPEEDLRKILLVK